MIDVEARHLLILLSAILVSCAVFAEESNESFDETVNLTNITTESLLGQFEENVTVDQTIAGNETHTLTNVPVTDFILTSFVPNEFKTGDVQFNIQVQNTGTVELADLGAFVTGKGFLTYEVVPIDVLKPGEKSYILVMGNIVEGGTGGTIKLTIKINSKVFYQNITVIGLSSGNNLQELDEAEQKKAAALSILKLQLDDIKKKYDAFENELEEKTENNYDVSGIDAEDFKNYVKDAQSSFLHNDVEQTNVSINLANSEYADLKKRLDEAEVIKRSILNILKDNAVLISTLAGAVIALFSLFEVLKSHRVFVSVWSAA
ncbi:hypothetical protein JXA85_05090 [Candidatus Woesearchaeota archaeon]|nr:hypothetical protein [Candidatus Woesearchaeota archaeon]